MSLLFLINEVGSLTSKMGDSTNSPYIYGDPLFEFRNTHTFKVLATIKNDAPKLYDLLVAWMINGFKKDPHEKLEKLYEMGMAAKCDMNNHKNYPAVQAPSRVLESTSAKQMFGISGQKIEDNGNISIENPANNFEVLPAFNRNPEQIMSEIEKKCHDINKQIRELDDEVNKALACLTISEKDFTEELTKIRSELLETQLLQRRYQALTYTQFCPARDFRCICDSWNNFFSCLKKLPHRTERMWKDTLQSTWTLQGGPDQTIMISKDETTKHKSSFDLHLRFGCGLKDMIAVGDPILTVTADDGKLVNCTVNFTNFDRKTLTIEKITFNNFKKISGNFTYLRNFYVLNVKQNMKYMDHIFEVQCKTFPFTLYSTSSEHHAAKGAVKWHIFSQEEENPDVYTMQETLPMNLVLQMLNLLAKNIGKYLDKEEREELSKLLAKQNPNRNIVSQESFLQKKMINPRDSRKVLNFSLYTLFQAGLNTLEKLKPYWMESLMVGFYSVKSTNKLLSRTGDAVVRLSQRFIEQPQGMHCQADIVIHLRLDSGENYMHSVPVSESFNFTESVRAFRKPNSLSCSLVIRLLPKGDDVAEHNPVQKNGYFKAYRSSKIIIPVSEFEDMSLQETSPPGLGTHSALPTKPIIPSVVKDHLLSSVSDFEHLNNECDEPLPKRLHLDYEQLRENSIDPFMESAAVSPSSLPEDLDCIDVQQLFRTGPIPILE